MFTFELIHIYVISFEPDAVNILFIKYIFSISNQSCLVISSTSLGEVESNVSYSIQFNVHVYHPSPVVLEMTNSNKSVFIDRNTSHMVGQKIA